jgi:glycosyltransferase involved in cell wall biosynthesis
MKLLSPAFKISDGSTRIGVVQHGDYAAARQLMDEGKSEIYTGQRYTIRTLDRFFGQAPHLVISREGATPPTRRGAGMYTCEQNRRLRGMPTRIGMYYAGWRMKKQLKAFGPTHLILRCSDLVGCELLKWAKRRGIPAAVITAMRFDPTSEVCRQFCRLASDDNVVLVANHLPAATNSMYDCGLKPGKGVAYDFPASVDPKDFAPKASPVGAEPKILFAGVMSAAKGVLDLLRAGERLRESGRKVRLVFLGDGPAREQVRSHVGAAEGWIHAPGRVGHDYVIEQMRASTVQVVPSRPEYTEGMPFVIAEGLAVRTPLVVSDHPIFVKYFREGQGVKFFPAGNDSALASRIGQLLGNAGEYERMSNATSDSWSSFQVATKFHHLIEQLAARWRVPNSAGTKHAQEYQRIGSRRRGKSAQGLWRPEHAAAFPRSDDQADAFVP